MTVRVDLLPGDHTRHTVPDSAVARVPFHAASAGLYSLYGKRPFDLVLLVAILPIIVPVMLVTVLALMISGAAPFYTQDRVGQHGRIFRIWKFRTMHPDADHLLDRILSSDPVLREEWALSQKLKHDPRITPLGHILRKASIDELPQVWNVLRGEMSFLGPRPMLPEQASLYGPGLSVYTALRPGISGRWQVSERNETFFIRRVDLDMEYARDLSFWNDLKLVARTLRTVLYSTGY